MNVDHAVKIMNRSFRNCERFPYLKSKGELNEKFPGGIKAHKQKLEEEGHKVVQKGKRFFVFEFEKRLVKETSLK